MWRNLQKRDVWTRKKKAAKAKKSAGQRGLKTQCDCGSTVLITPGTTCGTCKVRVPEKLAAKGKQPCQGCGREDVRADEACGTCNYMWTNPEASPKESAYTDPRKPPAIARTAENLPQRQMTFASLRLGEENRAHYKRAGRRCWGRRRHGTYGTQRKWNREETERRCDGT